MNVEPSQPAKADIVRMLNGFIEVCTDGEKGYAIAAADVRAPMLKALFRNYSEQRADFVRVLQIAVRELGGYPENHGSARGAAHRGFMSVRRAIDGEVDTTLIAECERGERSALATYDRAFAELAFDLLPPSVRRLLVDQRASIELAHADMLRRLAGTTR